MEENSESIDAAVVWPRAAASIAEALNTRDSMVKDLEYQLMRLRKGFNDSLVTQSSHMAKLGVPQEEIEKMGFVSFADRGTSSAPAGLVAGGKRQREEMLEEEGTPDGEDMYD